MFACGNFQQDSGTQSGITDARLDKAHTGSLDSVGVGIHCLSGYLARRVISLIPVFGRPHIMGTSPTAAAAGQQSTGHSVAPGPAIAAAPALPGIFERYRSYVEQALSERVPAVAEHPVNTPLRYHLGWADRTGTPSPTPASQGKALRPTLCIFACDAFQGQPERAAPAAAALELIHNFSLVHDDIQDEGAERRHQPTVWALWGTAQALAAGDAMQSLGDLAVLNDCGRIPAHTAIRVSGLLTNSCLEMIEGQCRDLQFEQRSAIATDEYLDMIALKTGALIRCSLEIGAAIATDDADTIRDVARFGRSVGRLFQIRDDYLGIWGDEAVTGKSADSDIVQRKKSYPIVYAFQEAAGAARAELLRLYALETMDETDVCRVLEVLEDIGAARQTDYLTELTADEARAALAMLELPSWAAADAENLVDFLARRLF